MLENIMYPNVGERLYLSQRTGDCYVDIVKHPYTVIKVTKNRIDIQAAKCIFPERRYYNTLPLAIEEDTSGKIISLHWSKKKQMWQYNTDHHAGYPEYAFFGNWEYYPYLR